MSPPGSRRTAPPPTSRWCSSRPVPKRRTSARGRSWAWPPTSASPSTRRSWWRRSAGWPAGPDGGPMIELELARLVRAAVDALRDDLDLEEVPEIEISRPRQKQHGDYATGVALAIGAAAGRNPREVAESLLRHLPDSDLVVGAEVA